LLIARDVFVEVKLGFFVIGHTHEDIDGWFGWFDEGVHGFLGATIYSLVEFRRFQIISCG
jgi:hypothetical protein